MNTELKILNTASAFSVFAASLFAPFYAVFVKEIGGGAFLAGTSYSIYAIAAGLLILASSKLEEDVVDTQKLVVLGYFSIYIRLFWLSYGRKSDTAFLNSSHSGFSHSSKISCL